MSVVADRLRSRLARRLLAVALAAAPLVAGDCDGGSSSGRSDDGTRSRSAVAGGDGSSGGGLFSTTSGPPQGPGPSAPEPGSFVLFAVGAALAAGALRRAKGRAASRGGGRRNRAEDAPGDA